MCAWLIRFNNEHERRGKDVQHAADDFGLKVG